MKNKNTLLLFALLLLGLEWGHAQELQRLEVSHQLMGTTFKIIVFAADEKEAHLAIDSAFERIHQLDTILSDYLPGSELNLLAAKAGKRAKTQVSQDLWNVLRLSRSFSRRSKGLFDASIGPLSHLWRRAFRKGKFPDTIAIRKAKYLVDYKLIRLYPKSRQARLLVAGMRLDVGGIAKGYAVDEAYRILAQRDFPIALVDGGGDLYAGAPPPAKKGWKIGMKTLHESGEIRDTTLLAANCGIATSGDTYRFLEWEGKRYSHIIHPKTGLGASNRRLVSVFAASCTTADALASIFSLTSKKESDKIARKYHAPFITIIFADECRQLNF